MRNRVRIASKVVLYPVREGKPANATTASLVASRDVAGSVMLQMRGMTTSRNDFIARTDAILSYVPQRPR
jgi:hypothetical protein